MFNVVVEVKSPEIVEVLKSILNVMLIDRQLKNAPQGASAPTLEAPAQPQYFPQIQEQPVQQQIPQQQVQPQQMPLQQAQPQQLPQQQMQTQTPQPGPVPTATQTYTLEQLSVAATALIDAGRRMELISLLGSFGVPALTALPQDQYGNFATHLRSMGAKI
ncbi:hypothetical protein E4K67_17345 [Desulfosporosinus fructosivorans]|uniref:Uncharacterized protein n=1 Tax=Desulfosporosinus fructosivorans TaxID=2018669 RepID=A0A4Z0R2M9_9FIRM|nr:hypothetical protein [Desulfosporosinus fructosivorans]TGE36864.1 hypothetical protein E4K67_17345 [Desulfosporosinus fructosivorans]